MQAAEGLTEIQWKIADAIANELTRQGSGSLTELRKAVSYLRAYSGQEDPGKNFFSYLEALAKNGSKIGHSNQTPEYYKSIQLVYNKYLRRYEEKPADMLQILGWAVRFMHYYKTFPIGELPSIPKNLASPKVIAMQEALQQLSTSKLKEGQTLDAKVVNKQVKGKQVTYELLGFEFKEREPKNFDLIAEGAIVKVEIKSLKEDGTINHVKFFPASQS
uniref:Uncharacterized protein n=1 Tax=Cyanothece sp. (strain PCC 7425 / ATCC 29141) TaxID=395961 RepID=B8HZK5_CYAP4